jgi:hypothetical protein
VIKLYLAHTKLITLYSALLYLLFAFFFNSSEKVEKTYIKWRDSAFLVYIISSHKRATQGQVHLAKVIKPLPFCGWISFAWQQQILQDGHTERFIIFRLPPHNLGLRSKRS